MSILIRGMKMPQKCGQCKLFHAEHPMHCMIVEGHRTVGAPYGMPRPDWCPLVGLPPHGRLIDADKIDFRNDAMHDGTGNLVVADNFINGILWLNDCIDRTPTVIEAEGREE